MPSLDALLVRHGLTEDPDEPEEDEDEEDPEDRRPRKTSGTGFEEAFGWLYSVTQVAAHERITLEQAFDLPITQALNDMVYLRALAKHEKQLAKQQTDAEN